MADIDITFPEGLLSEEGGYPSIVRFRVYDRTPNQVGSPDAVIRLPVPLALSNNYAIQFDDLESGLLGKSIETIAGNEQLREQFNNILDGSDVDFASIAASLGSSSLDILRGGAAAVAANSDILRRLGGFSFNKAGQLTINKPSNRNFSFRFSLVPNSAKEANQIQKIIEVFKYAMHPPVPAGGNQFVYLNPARFLIDFLYNPGAEQNNKLFNSYFCFLTGLEVNQHEAGSPAYFEGGYPEQRSIALTFQELSPLNRQNIKDLEPSATGITTLSGTKSLDSTGWELPFELYGNTIIPSIASSEIGTSSPREDG